MPTLTTTVDTMRQASTVDDIVMSATAADATFTDGMNIVERGVKRVFDIVASLLGLVLLSPLFLVVAILIKAAGDGPVFFRQERIGYRGRPFHILKFRTMATHCEEDGVPRLTPMGDRRVTPLGRMLRSHHLDELPQLVNILRGKMSLVGPRPERQFFIDQIMQHDANYKYIYCMVPGATSMATIDNGYTDTMDKMLRRLHMDLDYYRNRSLWLDAKILLVTARHFIAGKRF